MNLELTADDMKIEQPEKNGILPKDEKNATSIENGGFGHPNQGFVEDEHM